MTKNNQVQKLEGEQVTNPYLMASEAARVEGPGTTLAQAESQKSMIEVMTAFQVAKSFPRDMVIVADKILKECSRPTLANLAVYEYSKGGTKISGPTIRLMECIARSMGNIRFGWQCLDSTALKSSIRAFAFDLENNILRETTFDVKHWRDISGKEGYQLKDEREIYELQANKAMRRVRGCLEGLVPRDVIDMALEQCDRTNKASVDTSPEGIAKLLEAFATLGVNRAMIEDSRQGLKMESMTPVQIVGLRKNYAAIRDGIAKVEDIFDLSLADPSEKEKKKQSGGQPDLTKAVNEKKAEENPSDKKAEDKSVFKQDKKTPAPPIVTEILTKIKEVKTLGELDQLWNVEYEANLKVIEKDPGPFYADLMEAAQKRRQELSGKML